MKNLLHKKLSNLQNFLIKERIDFLVIGNFGQQIADDVLYYLLLKRLEFGCMIIPRLGKPVLYAIPFETVDLKHSYPELNVRPFRDSIVSCITETIKKKTVLGFRSSALPVTVWQQLKKEKKFRFKNFRQDKELFATKLPEEIDCLRRATDITDRLFTSLISHWETFRTETDVSKFLLQKMQQASVEPSFPSIIASGRHAASPHYHPHSTPIRKGFCVIDMGVRYKGYCSDMTRTIFVGQPTKKERSLYERLLQIQMRTIENVKPGAKPKQLDLFCRNELGDLNTFFIHGLGHGVGTQVHEWPAVNSNNSVPLTEGMVITIEPGLYLAQKYGIRIEDDVLVTKSGCEILTKSPKELIVV